MGFQDYNGGAVVAMRGKNCVALAVDARLGVQYTAHAADNFKKLYEFTSGTFAAFPGLATDSQSFAADLRYRVNLLRHEEGREPEPEVIGALVSSMMYEKRFSPWIIEPILAGLSKQGEPLIARFDILGTKDLGNYGAAGSAALQLHGLCESYWREDLGPEDLFETVSQVLLAAMEGDCFSGLGAEVIVVTPDKTLRRKIKTRMD